MNLRILSDEQLHTIHQASLKILSEVGVQFRGCPEALTVLESGGCRIDEERAYFSKEIIEECIGRIPPREDATFFVPTFGMNEALSLKKGESHFGLIGNAYYFFDFETAAYRDCREEDKENKALILEHLDNFEFDFCLLYYHSERSGSDSRAAGNTVGNNPKSCVEFLTRWVSDRAAGEGRRFPIAHPRYSAEEIRLATLGNMVLDGNSKRMEDLMEKSDLSFVWCNPISPLQYHPDEAARIVETARSNRRYRTIIISPEVMMGATGPVTLAGTLVQLNAEVLAGTILAQLANPGTQVIYGCVSAPMDLRNAEISQGNFETAMLNAAAVQLADRYGLPSRIAPGNTSDRKPGLRAAVENAVGLVMGAAAGGNLITTGLLDSTLMISYEHLALVDELISQVKNVTRDISTDADSLALEVIQRAGHPSPDFLLDEHTLRHMTRDVYYSDFTGRVKSSYEEWSGKAHDRVKDILGRRAPGPDGARVSAGVAKRLDAVLRVLDENTALLKKEDPDWWQVFTRDF